MIRESMHVLVLASTALLAVVIGCGGGSGEPSTSRDAAIRRIMHIGKSDGRATEHALALCRIGARPAGSKAHREACEWALRKFEEFGLQNVHLEECGPPPASMAEGGGSADSLYPVDNVVADIPGAVRPDEYVIVGAHIDSAPIATGATDNAAGVAAVMEAARMLALSGAKPDRTIRFILFGGEESGLIGSKGYLAAHPDLIPRISAMYNMDRGSNYISKMQATEPLREDMETIFAPVAAIDSTMPLRIESVDYLPKADPNCCAGANMIPTFRQGDGAPAVCAGAMVKVMRRASDGTLVPVEKSLEELGISLDDLAAGRDSLGGCRTIGMGDGDVGIAASTEDLDDPRFLERIAAGGGKATIMVAGSSDHAPFLAAGIPAFYWGQEGDTSLVYPAHTERDTYESVVPRYLEHNAVVVAIGALGTANLGHMLSRERLAKPAEEKASM